MQLFSIFSTYVTLETSGKRPFIIWEMRERIRNSWHGRNCWLQLLGSRQKNPRNATYKQSTTVELYAFTIVIQTRRKTKLLCSFSNTTLTKFVVSSNFTDTYSINKRKISRLSLYLPQSSKLRNVSQTLSCCFEAHNFEKE